MKRFILAAAFGAVLAIGGTASAAHKDRHAPKGPKASKCLGAKAFVVKGVLTETSVVTETGVEGFDVTRANKHARNAGFGPDGANDPGSYELMEGKTVKTSGFEEGEAPAAGDKVRVLGKIPFDRCGEKRDGDARGYEGDPVVKKIKVIDTADEDEVEAEETE